MSGRSIRLLLVVVLITGLVAAFRSSPSGGDRSADVRQASPSHPPIVLLGLDGLEWNVVLEMLHDGRLPALAGLMKRGVFGELETLQPAWSPAIWTSAATGKLPEKHGITGFVRSAEGRAGQRLYTNADRSTKAVWNILSDFGRSVTMVGWWMTFPVEEINGVMVAQVNTTTPEAKREGKGMWKGSLVEGLDGQVHPPERQHEILSIMRTVEHELPDLTEEVFGEFSSELGPLPRRLWRNCLWAFRADAVYHRVGRRLISDTKGSDLFGIYFGGSDVVGHRFWRYAHPHLYDFQPTEQEIDELGPLVGDYYAYLDRVLAGFISAAGDDTIFVVMSDHGMVPVNRAGSFALDGPPKEVKSGGHRDGPPGVFVAAGPGIRSSGNLESIEDMTREDLVTIGSVVDVTPTLLALLGIPVGRDMDGRVMTEIIEPSFLAEHPVTYVRSHESWLSILGRWFDSGSRAKHESSETLERLEQLRALGYIE